MSLKQPSRPDVSSDLLLIVERHVKCFGKQLETVSDNIQLDSLEPLLESFVALKQMVAMSQRVFRGPAVYSHQLMKSVRLALYQVGDDPRLLDLLYSTSREVAEFEEEEFVFEFVKLLRALSLAHIPSKRWLELLQFVRSLMQGLEDLSDDYKIRCLKVLRMNPGLKLDFMRFGQRESMLFLIEELERFVPDLPDKFIVLLAGRYGLFSEFMFHRFPNGKGRVISVDANQGTNTIAEDLNRPLVAADWKFKTMTADIHSLDYDRPMWRLQKSTGQIISFYQSADLYVNLNCDCIDDFDDWLEKIPAKALVALQSSNAPPLNGRINTVRSLEDFMSQVRLSEIISQATLKFKDYNRFSLIGRK